MRAISRSVVAGWATSSLKFRIFLRSPEEGAPNQVSINVSHRRKRTVMYTLGFGRFRNRSERRIQPKSSYIQRLQGNLPNRPRFGPRGTNEGKPRQWSLAVRSYPCPKGPELAGPMSWEGEFCGGQEPTLSFPNAPEPGSSKDLAQRARVAEGRWMHVGHPGGTSLRVSSTARARRDDCGVCGSSICQRTHGDDLPGLSLKLLQLQSLFFPHRFHLVLVSAL